MHGHAGKLLWVNLSTGAIRVTPLSYEMAHTYLGGRGFAARILYDRLDPGIDPLGPKNVLVLASGLLVGSPAPAANRAVLAAKSPLTGLWGTAAIGGRIGIQLKRAGFDAVIIEGQSVEPVYLWIHDGQAELRDASAVWGLETGPSQRAIEQEVDAGSVLGIGPGGENLVRYAIVLGDLRFSASRSGMGAVMGSKRLKAIAIRGTGRVTVAHRSEVVALVRGINKEIRENASCATLSRYGTWNNLTSLQLRGMLPTKNFQAGVIAGGERIDSDGMSKALSPRRETCPGCPIFCRPIVRMETPYNVSGEYGGPQYETVAALGSLLMITDPAAIAKAHELLNRYGVDTIATGVCAAFAMECWERGIDLGRPLPWGDPETLFLLIEEITYRKGVGAILADGVCEAARRIGQGSEDWAMAVKGQELPLHDPRGKKGMALAYATVNRGADHMQSIHEDAMEVGGPFPELGLSEPMSRFQLEGKPYLVKITQDAFGVMGDTLGVCKFPMNAWRPLTPSRVARLVHLVTGWDFDLQDLLLVGERIFNLCRLFNVREGVRREDDTIPGRLGVPFTEGASAGETVTAEDLSTMLDEYYALRGWDDDGVPTAATLAKLGLER